MKNKNIKNKPKNVVFLQQQQQPKAKKKKIKKRGKALPH